MHGLFNYDGPVVQIMNKIADCICLSLLWLLCSLPLVTVGAATTALYYAMNKCVRRSGGGVWRTFWQGFFGNFKQSTALWLLQLLVYGVLLAGCYSAYLMCTNGILPVFLFYGSLILPAAVFLWSCYLFPYAAKFQDPTRLILKNCVYIALMNVPTGLMHLGIMIGSLIAAAMIPFAVICVPGVAAVISCYILENVFRKYMTEEERLLEKEKDQL